MDRWRSSGPDSQSRKLGKEAGYKLGNLDSTSSKAQWCRHTSFCRRRYRVSAFPDRICQSDRWRVRKACTDPDRHTLQTTHRVGPGMVTA